MKRWNTRSLRRAHGATHAQKRTAAGSAPARALLRLGAPATIQSPQAGRKSSGEGLNSAMAAQSRPKSNQWPSAGASLSSLIAPTARIRSVHATTHANRKVVNVVSHGQRTAYCIAAGYSAQSHADQRETRGEKDRMAISQIANAVAAENTD